MIAKIRVVLWIGIVLLFVPFFGLPDVWKTAFIIILGIVLIYNAFSLRRAYKRLKFELRQGAISQQVTQETEQHNG